jgi:rubrerythrin
LAFAVHNEEIAFSFYTHVAANSENIAVRKYAEILAREELGHAALLRAERRRAYHKERDANMIEPRLDSSAIQNETDLLAAAIFIDQYLTTQMQALAESSSEIKSLANATQQQITHNEIALNNNISKNNVLPNEVITKNIDQLKLFNATIKPVLNQPGMALQRLWSCSDRSFSFYDAVVASTENEAVMLTAQQLSSLALDRIHSLKQVFEYPAV